MEEGDNHKGSCSASERSPALKFEFAIHCARRSGMTKFKLSLLAVLAVVVGFVLFNKYWGFLRHNTVTVLLGDRGYFFPEELVPGQWAFWCMSGNPGIDSQTSHLVLAANFAKQHQFGYIGPRKYEADWLGWPLIFVACDGTYKVTSIYGYEFNLFGDTPITQVCWDNGKAVISINIDRTLQVNKRK